MKYVNAAGLLPRELVQELQEYIQGGYIYVPAIHRRKAQPPAQLVEWDSPPGAKPLHFRLKAV